MRAATTILAAIGLSCLLSPTNGDANGNCGKAQADVVIVAKTLTMAGARRMLRR